MTVIETAMAADKADKLFDAVWKETLGCRLELEYEVAREFIKRIDQYNDFKASQVLHALDLIDEVIPRMSYPNLVDGKPNPNHNRRAFTIEVGRERSPVIYVSLYELHRYGSPQKALTGDDVAKIKSLMQDVGVADESDCEIEDFTAHGMGKRYTFRFWWD